MSKEHWLQLIQQRSQTGPVTLPQNATARLQQFDGIKAVIFDVYGTLFSSGVGDISLATNQNRDDALKATLRDNGFQLTARCQTARLDNVLHATIKQHQDQRRVEAVQYPEVEIREVWVDFIQQLVADSYVEHDFEADIETLVIDYESRINPTQAMPELESTLKQLVDRGIVLSIISNAQFYTPLLFETYLHTTLEDLKFSTDSAVWSYAMLEGKPSTRLYEVSAERMATHHSILANEVLYVGNDIRNDIWPAQAVGYRTALFAGDSLSLRRRESDPDCKHITADIEITSLAQILDCI
ncbi:HAD family hydrolase [Coraliomargarita akajimensis]|uniref:Haloacid dehalogenase domain protein hydrolase n=1 Tax=Coraliomargarita akajimensis (strain DSM 45221 / IAM 15411 / JCM 23193 / KCTC 12865 / 04OKA010-24) TaxID=583355 RepID=D5EIB6_CORAD|nr:HAD family hydrolase [Coraliomargarita akajimensis]ADE54182.1 Haloacid dehalogenase domain protein hydrolase [Coraliomargarita akajimensis DSM 45221]